MLLHRKSYEIWLSLIIQAYMLQYPLLLHVHLCPLLSNRSPPLPIMVVHFISSHFNTACLSSDASIYSQYSQYTLKIELFLFYSNSKSFNALKVNKQVKHILSYACCILLLEHISHFLVEWQCQATKVSTMVQLPLELKYPLPMSTLLSTFDTIPSSSVWTSFMDNPLVQRN